MVTALRAFGSAAVIRAAYNNAHWLVVVCLIFLTSPHKAVYTTGTELTTSFTRFDVFSLTATGRPPDPTASFTLSGSLPTPPNFTGWVAVMELS